MASKDNGLHEAKRHNPTIERSPEWEAISNSFMEKHPVCAVCGSKKDLEVHHIFPFHYCIELDRRDLELDPRNLITLCGSGGENHHLLIGHFDDWKSANLKIKDNKGRFGTTEKEIRDSFLWKILVKDALKAFDKISAIERAVLKSKINVAMPK